MADHYYNVQAERGYTIEELMVLASAYAHSNAHPAVTAVMDRTGSTPLNEIVSDAKLVKTFRAITLSERSWQALYDAEAIYSPKVMLARADDIKRAHGIDTAPRQGHMAPNGVWS